LSNRIISFSLFLFFWAFAQKIRFYLSIVIFQNNLIQKK